MSDRSDEVTESRDAPSGSSPDPNPRPRSTDDLLEETEQLLEESGGGSGPGTEPSVPDAEGAREPSSSESVWSSDEGTPTADFESGRDADADTERSGGLRSRLPSLGLGGLKPSLSPEEYFSPKEFLAVALLLGGGLIAGGLIPLVSVAGQLVGLFATAFLVGLLASKRRYLEIGAAGTSVGAVAALAEYAFFTLIGSASGTTLLAVGASAGFLAAVGGYYFGRDLRDGLARDIE